MTATTLIKWIDNFLHFIIGVGFKPRPHSVEFLVTNLSLDLLLRGANFCCLPPYWDHFHSSFCFLKSQMRFFNATVFFYGTKTFNLFLSSVSSFKLLLSFFLLFSNFPQFPILLFLRPSEKKKKCRSKIKPKQRHVCPHSGGSIDFDFDGNNVGGDKIYCKHEEYQVQ